MRSTFRTLFYLRKNQPKKDGTVAVMVKVSVNGESVQFNSKVDVNPLVWDSNAFGKSSSDCPLLPSLN